RLHIYIHASTPHPDLHSFPTRRSSDLGCSESPTTSWSGERRARPTTPPHWPASSGRGSRSRSSAMAGRSTGPQRTSSRTGSPRRSEEHTSELQSPDHLVCRLLLEKKKT